jgi:DNA repair protein RecN (Recombination protein N)
MLRSLSIKDFVIVDRLELEFSAGLTVLTGETGAGKSILIDALSLALGERGESGVIRSGCERAEIGAEFDVTDLPELQTWLGENEFADGNACLLRRILYADGRTRGFINGSNATMQQLREAGDLLVDIYSQHAHHSLLKAASQRALLDDFGAGATLASEVVAAYKRWRDAFERRVEMERNASAYDQELAELRDQLRELTQLDVSAEEWEALQQEHSRLAHAASLIAGSEACRELLAEGELAAARQILLAQHKLQELLEYDPAMQEVLDGLDAAAINLQEADRFLNRYMGRAELDPQRLTEVESRIQAIHAAARKHRMLPEQLPELLQKCQSRMAELDDAADDGKQAQQEAAAREQYLQLAKQLSALRKQAASSLSKQVTGEMQHLALSGGKFEVALNALEQGMAHGMEQVEFLVSGHAGMQPKPLIKTASGGELSRISLALRVVTAQQGSTPTMIFDEVDVGIGGGVAEIVGQLLARLGQSRQVLVITHLPQVAAQGRHHLQVSKSAHAGQTLSHIQILSEADRVEEIARMLGGVEITATTRKHAAEMLGV